MTVLAMHHLGIIVRDLDEATEFFLDIGLEPDGKTTVEGPFVDEVTNLTDVRSDIVMLRTPDGTGRVELARFQTPVDDRPAEVAAPNRVGLRHVAFMVDDLDSTLKTLQDKGYDLVGKVGNYQDVVLTCYVRGPEGIMVELGQTVTAGTGE